MGLRVRVLGYRSQASGFGSWVYVLGSRVSGLVLGDRFHSGHRIQVLGFSTRVSDFGFQVSVFRFQDLGSQVLGSQVLGHGFQVLSLACEV